MSYGLYLLIGGVIAIVYRNEKARKTIFKVVDTAFQYLGGLLE